MPPVRLSDVLTHSRNSLLGQAERARSVILVSEQRAGNVGECDGRLSGASEVILIPRPSSMALVDCSM